MPRIHPECSSRERLAAADLFLRNQPEEEEEEEEDGGSDEDEADDDEDGDGYSE
jgi:hypothetical protein